MKKHCVNKAFKKKGQANHVFSQRTANKSFHNLAISQTPTNRITYSNSLEKIHHALTNWGWDMMAAVLQMTFSNAFSWMKKVWISIKFSLKFVPMGSINNKQTLVQKMSWRRTSDQPLSETTVGSLMTYICVTQPQWVNGNCTVGTHSIWLICHWEAKSSRNF